MNTPASLMVLVVQLLPQAMCYHPPSTTQTEPTCIDCGQLCPEGVQTVGYWCSDGQSVIENASVKVVDESWQLSVEFDNTTLAKCLPDMFLLVEMKQGFCCTWSYKSGCQVIGVEAVTGPVQYPCDTCKEKCTCSVLDSLSAAPAWKWRSVFWAGLVITEIL